MFPGVEGGVGLGREGVEGLATGWDVSCCHSLGGLGHGWGTDTGASLGEEGGDQCTFKAFVIDALESRIHM